jgi:hypothetical protein
MWLPTNYGNLLIDRYSTGIQCTVGYTGGCKLKSDHTVGYTGACKLNLITPWDTQVQMFKWYVSSRIVYKDKHKKQFRVLG